MTDEPSAVSHPVPGYPPSGLTDPGRMALGDLAVANTMQALGVDEDAARELLGGYAEQGRVVIPGDRRLVGLFVDEPLFAIAERAWPRGLVHPPLQLGPWTPTPWRTSGSTATWSGGSSNARPG